MYFAFLSFVWLCLHRIGRAPASWHSAGLEIPPHSLTTFGDGDFNWPESAALPITMRTIRGIGQIWSLLPRSAAPMHFFVLRKMCGTCVISNLKKCQCIAVGYRWNCRDKNSV